MVLSKLHNVLDNRTDVYGVLQETQDISPNRTNVCACGVLQETQDILPNRTYLCAYGVLQETHDVLPNRTNVCTCGVLQETQDILPNRTYLCAYGVLQETHDVLPNRTNVCTCGVLQETQDISPNRTNVCACGVLQETPQMIDPIWFNNQKIIEFDKKQIIQKKKEIYDKIDICASTITNYYVSLICDDAELYADNTNFIKKLFNTSAYNVVMLYGHMFDEKLISEINTHYTSLDINSDYL